MLDKHENKDGNDGCRYRLRWILSYSQFFLSNFSLFDIWLFFKVFLFKNILKYFLKN